MALPVLVIDGPGHEPLPRGRLLDIARPIRPHAAINGDRDLDDRWIMNGVTWTPEPCLALFTNDVNVCIRVDFLNAPRTCDAAITQTAFSLWDALKGNALDWTPEDIEAIVEGRVTRKVSAGFASELLSGAISGDKALSKSAHQPNGISAWGTAIPIWLVLAKLEDDLARTQRGSRGYIHMPPGLLGQAEETYGLMLNGDGQWETPLGNVVIADAGYAGATAPTGQSAGDGTKAWVYASGEIRYGISDLIAVDGGNIGSTITNYTDTDTSELYPRFKSRDDIVRIVDVFGILVFDPCPVTAALASYEQTDVV